ncbi:MAG: STAS domain-containing protein [Chloroflexi bacterium]|nr:STAS domain-containing protein [Chloroflexota bacterium]
MAGFGTYKFAVIQDIWDVSTSSRLVMLATFLSTLVLPIQQAVLVGIILSILDFVYTSTQDMQISELVENEDGMFAERPSPTKLTDNSVTILYSWSPLFFASARAMDDLLPAVGQAKQAVVILRLHGRSRIGSTYIQIVERYEARLQANGGKLMLSGVSQNVWDQLERTETFEAIPEADVFMVDEILGNSTRKAAAAAKEWLAQLPTAKE